MVLSVPAKSKINTQVTQLAPIELPQPAQRAKKAARGAGGLVRVAGDSRWSTRDSARVVVEVGCGVPAGGGGRAVAGDVH
jgi:hypothetical protein